ncbi:ABC transporter substrate-binding protein [Actinosynnema pretiosum]|uniref:Sugar ABC transporter substrate-binding protein n=1 Tax=Actinosynnema pretiosum TaxID=42197 RepID=A0A290Z5R1_9PSEU|nr:sugar ABC transporter substrate-binding protein [Actinosynnema pretiosum]ATE54391.1 sugar ABC transporter substrate-binding protein [Actinosynnema pretiosum]
MIPNRRAGSRARRWAGLAAALSLAVTGCGPGATADPNTLTVSVWNLASTPEFQALFDAFEQANPGVTVKPVDIVAADYPEKVTTMLAGGDRTDVITMKNVTDYARHSSRGQLQDVTDLVEPLKSQGLRGLEAFESDGRYFAAPYRQDFWVLYYNKTLFQQAGVPAPEDWTWAEYADAAKRLTTGSGGDKTFGAYHHVWRSVVQAIAAAQNDGDQLSGDYGFFTEQYTTALRMQAEGSVLDYGTATTQQADYRSTFEKAKAAMLPMGTWYTSSIVKAKREGDSRVDWGIAPLPQRAKGGEVTTFGSPTAFAANRNADNSDLAREFVAFAAGEEGAKAITKVGVVPALRSEALTDAYFQLDGMAKDELSTAAFRPDHVALEMPVSKRSSAVDSILKEEHELIMVGEKSVADGIRDMGERVRTEAPE